MNELKRPRCQDAAETHALTSLWILYVPTLLRELLLSESEGMVERTLYVDPAERPKREMWVQTRCQRIRFNLPRWDRFPYAISSLEHSSPCLTSSPCVAATRAERHGRNGIFSFYVKRVQREMRRENNLNNCAESKAEGCFTRSGGVCVCVCVRVCSEADTNKLENTRCERLTIQRMVSICRGRVRG